MTRNLLEDVIGDELRCEPILRPGNTNCGGCGMSVGLNFLSLATGKTPIQIVIPACCGIVTAGPYPLSAYGAPVVASTFASAAALATGLAKVAQINDEKTRVICWAGDGGTYDIGLATLSAAAERNENLIYVCYDNEIYGNTGGQRSSATPPGAVTTTTPGGKIPKKKDIVRILAAHGIPYAATVSLAHPEDAVAKMRYALHEKGFRFLHILSPCPTGWKSEPGEGIELIRAAVRSGLFPVYEMKDGERCRINVEPSFARADLETWFRHQGRFTKGDVDVAAIAAIIEASWSRLRREAEVHPEPN